MSGEIEVGDEFVQNAELDPPFRTLHHVRGFVDDRVVLRHWRFSKKRWEYIVEPRWLLAEKFGYTRRR